MKRVKQTEQMIYQRKYSHILHSERK